MNLTAIFCLFVICITASAGVVYKTVKEDGTVVYSDVPSEGSKSVTLSAINTVQVPVKKTPSISVRPSVITKPAIQYLISVRSPMPEESLRNNAGELTITADVTPKKSGKFQLVMDGQVVKTQTSSQFKLENIQRGAHLIQVNFLDNSGKILASSKQQTFYLHKASALINAN
jgi:hypothetical protein